jgi:flagellar motor component MotA
MGGVIVLASLVLVLLFNGSLSYFINGPSFVLVVVFICLGALTSFRLNDLMRAVSIQFSFQRLPENDALLGHQVFRRLSELAIGGGVIGTVIGLTQMLQALDDPSAIGPAMAVALCTMFYGLVFSEVFFRPLAADALARGGVTRDVGQRGQEWRLMGVLGGLFMLLLVFFVMLFAMADFS